MNRNDQAVTRDEWTATIPANGKATFYGPCDYFSIFSIANAGGIAQSIKMAVNRSNGFASVRAGAGLQGAVGGGEVQAVHFHNTSGGSVDVVMVFGNGQGIPGTVYVQSGTLDISAASIASIVNGLSAALLAPVLLEPIGEDISAPTTYTGCKSLFIENNHTTLDLDVSWDGGGLTLPPGANIRWTVETDTNYFIPITVDVAPTGTAKISGARLAT